MEKIVNIKSGAGHIDNHETLPFRTCVRYYYTQNKRSSQMRKRMVNHKLHFWEQVLPTGYLLLPVNVPYVPVQILKTNAPASSVWVLLDDVSLLIDTATNFDCRLFSSNRARGWGFVHPLSCGSCFWVWRFTCLQSNYEPFYSRLWQSLPLQNCGRFLGMFRKTQKGRKTAGGDHYGRRFF